MLDASSAAVKEPFETPTIFPWRRFSVLLVTYGVNEATLEFIRLNGCRVGYEFILTTTMTVFPFPVYAVRYTFG
jgi:hypothetical protein